MSKVFPLLKPHDWPHKQLVAHRPTVAEVEGAPIVAFGFNDGDNYQFVPKEKVGNVEQLYSEALTNLAKLDYPWELGDSKVLRYATSSGNDFSAEKILDPAAMRKCHELLGAERIIATAPRRTCLFATRYDLSEDEMDALIRLTQHTYRDDEFGHAPIAPALFILEQARSSTRRY